jgi:hypothetical protein
MRTVLLLAVLALPGCLFVGGRGAAGARLPPGVEAQLLPGRTTRAEVLALLGPPTEYKRPELSSALVDDELRVSGALAVARRAENVCTWQYDRLTARGSLLLLWNGLSVRTSSDLLVVFFDERDLVADVAVRHAEDG